jgi:hypothetical protein
MKRWVVAAAFGAGACQAGTQPTISQHEAALEDCYGAASFCDAKMPQTTTWKAGEALPPLSDTSVVVTNLVSSSLWEAYGADPEAGKVMWSVQIKPDDFGAFMQLVVSKNHAFGGVRPPGGGASTTWCVDPRLILAVALRTSGVQAQAEADRAACDKR